MEEISEVNERPLVGDKSHYWAVRRNFNQRHRSTFLNCI